MFTSRPSVHLLKLGSIFHVTLGAYTQDMGVQHETSTSSNDNMNEISEWKYSVV